ncbi:MAG TPA: sulfite exporter TauE/SafE family protein [Patescibacteria group bacterium]|nr:sulfite exporter TauE/SafE family protein [Patescibacteria group bacterium]
MDKKLVKTSISIKDMTCSSCEIKVENTLKKLAGVMDAKVSLVKNKADISYDENMISIAAIVQAINDLGYQAAEIKESKENEKNIHAKAAQKNDSFKIDQLLGIGIIILALYIIIKRTVGFNFVPEIDSSMSYGVLFVVGVLTSLHCIAMCGGINLSQCVSHGNVGDDNMSKLKPSLLYNAGRVVSYTVVGGIVGAIGSVVSFSGMAKGLVAVLAGAFMIIMGLNMLNIFPWLRKFNIRMPKFIGEKIYSGKNNKGPFYVGLLNGFMPCGPLQSMQLYALGTGSFIAGAGSMFFFSLGTVPLMFGLGAISTILSKKFTNNLMKFSAILVIILGVGMISRGMSLSGINTVLASSQNANIAKIDGNVQTVSIDVGSNSYQPIIVQKGIPVKFIINAEQDNLNGCNNPVVIPQFGIEKELIAGENVIEFLPEETGTIPYSCWMGMIRSNIKVVDDITQVQGSEVEELNNASAGGLGGSCCDSSIGAETIADTSEEEIFVAKAENGLQVVTITVDEKGYSPNVIVLQKGVKAKFIFDPKSLNNCNSAVSFPEYGGALNLSEGDLETPELEITEDFGFTCWMGMLNGYVKVVDDIDNIDKESILVEANAYIPPGGSGGCH